MPSMREVAIIGAGELGGAVAQAIASHDVATTVRLVDETGTIAQGKALDIAQSAPILGFSTRITGAADFTYAAGASVLVIADSAAGGEWQGERGLALLTHVARAAPRAVIVCAGATQRELIDRGVAELRIDRRRLFGSAPEAMRAAACALVALSVDTSPKEVALTLAGVPPAHVVIGWQDATVGGLSLTRLLDEPARRRLAGTIAALWPPGPLALGAAACSVVQAIAGRSRRGAICFVAPERTAAGRTRTAAWPVRLNQSGIAEAIAPRLSSAEQVALENAVLL
jgi:malate dehydrogenase